MEGPIGFIGLGIMGKPMARNLMKAGYSLVVHNRSDAAVNQLVGDGAKSASSPNDIATQCRTTILMLPDGPDVEAVVCSGNGMLDALRDGDIIIDMSSINPEVSIGVAEQVAARGGQYIDAPVSGGEPRAIDGTLAIMVGCPDVTFDEVRPILECVGGSVSHVGEVGAGQTAKLVNQVLVALHIEAMGEAFLLATVCGVDCARVYEAIRSGLAGSNVLNAKVPLLLERNFKSGFRIELHQKDMRNAMAATKERGLTLPNAEKVMQIIDELVESGHGRDDHSGVVQAVEKRNGVRIGESASAVVT